MGAFGEVLLQQPLAEAFLTPTETTVLWGLHHPYWLAAIAVGLLLGIQMLLSAASQIVRHLLSEVSRSPFSFGRWLLNKTTARETPQQQIDIILNRLHSLQDEQAILLGELKKHLPNRD
ncbi:MAG: hypothetical protein AAF821_03850 [Cyanobacteria bacterium P01_D01_bin.156]